MDKKQYLLVCLLEELSEVQKAVSKAIRFGLDDVYEGGTNLDYIREELADVHTIKNLLLDDGVNLFLDDPAFTMWCDEKERKLKLWMEYSKERGCLVTV